MLGGAVAKRYAEALFSIAQDQNRIEEFEADLSVIVTALNEHPELKKFLQHPAISASVKKEQVAGLFEQAVSATVLNFVRLLLDRRRENELPKVHEQFVQMADQARGQVKAHIETAFPLNEIELKGLAEKLAAVCGKQLDITSSVNEELIAGARLKVGDRVIDASVKGQLDRLQQNIKRNQVQ